MIPAPPDFRIDWNALQPYLDPLRGCPQDPVHHAEGDVEIHTRMVLEWLAASPKWRSLDDEARSIVFLACLFHDVAKPECTRDEDGRITARYHSTRGAVRARRILWQRETPFAQREQVCNLIRYHQLPFFLVEKEDAQRRAIEVSLSARCDLLALVTEADASGRRCADQQRLLDHIELFRIFCHEEGCLDRAYPFPSAHARFQFLARGGKDPQYRPHEDFRSDVVLMSGLPGAGKDHTVQQRFADWAVISLDRLRAELDIDPDENQAGVIARARDEARRHLRRGGKLVWNATNLSRQLRTPLVSLFADYGARVRVVYVEVPEKQLLAQNRARSASVPKAVIERLLKRWEVPTTAEAHEIDLVV